MPMNSQENKQKRESHRDLKQANQKPPGQIRKQDHRAKNPARRILLMFFHPATHKSRINIAMFDAVKEEEGITARNMYDLYPDFQIEIEEEQALLRQHDLIIWQHPFYWYNAPSLLKEWMDLVLEHNFAYGMKGHALDGKQVMTALTTGGQKEAYEPDGAGRFSIPELLLPFRLSCQLCRMNYLPPWVVHGTHLLNQNDIKRLAQDYKQALGKLRYADLKVDKPEGHSYMNTLLKS